MEYLDKNLIKKLNDASKLKYLLKLDVYKLNARLIIAEYYDRLVNLIDIRCELLLDLFGSNSEYKNRINLARGCVLEKISSTQKLNLDSYRLECNAKNENEKLDDEFLESLFFNNFCFLVQSNSCIGFRLVVTDWYVSEESLVWIR